MVNSNARYDNVDNVSDTLSSLSEISEDEIDLSSCEGYCEEIGGWGKCAPEGITFKIYSQLLAAYLIQFDLANAKFLWKRIPLAIKKAHPELEKIWNIGKKIYLREFPEIYKLLNSFDPSSEELKLMISSLKEVIRKRAVNLLAVAYSSVSLSDFSAAQLNWTFDSINKMVYPVKPERCKVVVTANDEQLAKLTDFVAFLEN
ncbi:COP9 signalosome complex subunit 8 [Nymphon striatum]|nr:COP9 signalosome complex subunit 8 [Nymphon striatum]